MLKRLYRYLFGPLDPLPILSPRDTFELTIEEIRKHDPKLADEFARFGGEPFSKSREWLETHFPLDNWGVMCIWQTPYIIRDYPKDRVIH